MLSDMNERLSKLIGKKGYIKIKYRGELQFTVLAIEPPAEPQRDMESAISHSKFTVRLDDGVLMDGSNTPTILGQFFTGLNGGAY
jgi:hypothetical protein